MFDVDPDQIQNLDATQLVMLLRRLLHAEAHASGLPLSGVSVPLQINVPDGGEDGRISWEGGNERTSYLPGRKCFFQCKATKLGKAGWAKECWDKSTHKKGSKRKINSALSSLMVEGGCYLGFTTEAMTGERRDEYIAAMNDAIVETGSNPANLGKIELYDANKIADWATQHPSVATWVAERQIGHSLAGFRTVESWGTRSDFKSAYVEDENKRYSVGTDSERDSKGADNRTTANTAWAKIVDHIAEPGRTVRVIGTSGLGKSRFVYEALQASSSLLGAIFFNSTIFAEYKTVASYLRPVAETLASSRNRTLLVVDECPRDVAAELGELSVRTGSSLSVITIDTDERHLEAESILHVALSPSGADLVEAIIRNKNPSIDKHTIERLREMCAGFPRFAVLAADTGVRMASRHETIDDVINRILVGARITTEEQERALQCLSLFESLSTEFTKPVELDVVAERIARMSGDAMYEHLVKAAGHDMVGRSADRMNAQPRPIADLLARRRLDAMRPQLIVSFIVDATDELALSMLRRFRYFDKSQIVTEVANRLLTDHLNKAELILSARGAATIDALVHVIPNSVGPHLNRHLQAVDDDVLAAATEGRRSLVEATARLMFRARTFENAARLMMRLAVNENEAFSSNATDIFKQLFQVYLSGTEVSPDERLFILDEAIESGDSRKIDICIDALGVIFSRRGMRFGDFGSIGTEPNIVDWFPETLDEVHNFFRGGIQRLKKIRRNVQYFAEKCEIILVGSARSILNTELYEEFGTLLVEISTEKGGWPDAIESVGDWLYFDRTERASPRSQYIRNLYTTLFPVDLIEQAIIFTKYWQIDIRNPDVIYAEDSKDFEYSAREAVRVAGQIGEDPDLTLQAVHRMTPMDLKTVFPFADRLAQCAHNRVDAFQTALEIVVNKQCGMPMLRGLLHGIDAVDASAASECLLMAKKMLDGSHSIVNLYGALALDRERLATAINDLEEKKIEPADCVYLSYGRGLDALEPDDVASLLHVLTRYDSEGIWAALEIAIMYRLGTPIPSVLSETVASLLVAPALIGPGRDRNRDSHVIVSLIDRVHNSIGISENFAVGLAQQVVRLAKSAKYDLIDNLIDSMRHVVEVLVKEKPASIWAHLAHFHDTATPIELSRLRRIIGPGRDNFDRSSHTEAGPLFGIPESPMIQWADVAEGRAAFLLDFYPILQSENETVSWHPALVDLVDRYGKQATFRKALQWRMRPSTWSGSIVPLLEEFLEPLKQWHEHSIREVATWSKRMHRILQDEIEKEQERETS